MDALGSAPGQRVTDAGASDREESAAEPSLETTPLAAATSTPSALEATTPWVRRWLRAEGVVAFIGGVLAWVWLGGNPVILVALILIGFVPVAWRVVLAGDERAMVAGRIRAARGLA